MAASSNEWSSVISKRSAKKERYVERKSKEEKERYEYYLRLDKIEDERKELKNTLEVTEKNRPRLGPVCSECLFIANQYDEVYNPDNDPSSCEHNLNTDDRKRYDDWEILYKTALNALWAHQKRYGHDFSKV
jgi:hypothetical protein